LSKHPSSHILHKGSTQATATSKRINDHVDHVRGATVCPPECVSGGPVRVLDNDDLREHLRRKLLARGHWIFDGKLGEEARERRIVRVGRVTEY
jgi:hypothetical protein